MCYIHNESVRNTHEANISVDVRAQMKLNEGHGPMTRRLGVNASGVGDYVIPP